MFEEDINPAVAVPEGADVTPSEGGANDGSSLTLEQINAITGRNYKDVQSAMLGIQETMRSVDGTKQFKQAVGDLKNTLGLPDEKAVLEHVRNVGKSGEYLSRTEYERDMFFATNPQYADVKDIILDMAQARNLKPAEVVQLDRFKEVYGAYSSTKSANEAQSVIHSNPRLGHMRDSMSEARDLVKASRTATQEGDISTAIQAQGQASSKAVSAVIEAFDLEK